MLETPDETGVDSMHRKRILIFTVSFGSGHRSAADAIESYVKAHHRESVEVRVIDYFKAFAPAVNSIAGTLYDGSVQAAPELYRLFFELTDRIADNSRVKDMGQTGFSAAIEFIESYRPDAVIATFPIAMNVLRSARRGRPLPSAVVVTDFGVHRQWYQPETDLTFVAAEDIRRGMIAMGMDESRVIASGIPVKESFADPIDRSLARATLGLEDRFTVLMTPSAGPTSDQRDMARTLLQAGMQIVAITGRSRRLKSRLHTLQRRHRLLHVLGFTREMHTYMCACDVLVGKAGGLTVSECLATGLPLIANNSVPGQETYNADFVDNHGAGLLARDADDAALKVLFLSEHPARLAQLSETARALGRPDAAKIVVERILDLIESSSPGK